MFFGYFFWGHEFSVFVYFVGFVYLVNSLAETFAKPHFLPNFCVPGERDFRSASTGSNFHEGLIV